MLLPKRTKHRKVHYGRMKGTAMRGNRISYGEFGLVAMEPGWIKSNQIEATRIAMTRYMKRVGKVWIKIFPDKPYTKKPIGTRMGKGKGNLEGWAAVIRPGRVLFEISGVTEDVAREALRLAAHKLPIKTKFYSKANLDAEVNAKLGIADCEEECGCNCECGCAEAEVVAEGGENNEE